MSPPTVRRAQSYALAVALALAACSGDPVVVLEPGDGAARADASRDADVEADMGASDASDASIDASVDADVDGGVECCPVQRERRCDCVPTGGRKEANRDCPRTCDSHPDFWTYGVDEFGCEVLYPGFESCLGQPDGGVADAGTVGACVAPMPLPDNGIGTGTTIGGTDHGGECFEGTGAADVTYSFAAPRLIYLTVHAGGYDTVLHLYRGDCSAAGLLACNDDDRKCEIIQKRACPEAEIRASNLAAGTYFIVVDGHGGAAGTYTSSVTGFIAAGEPCDPAQTYLRCEIGTCSQGPGGYFCPADYLDCADGYDSDQDSSIDEDAPICVSPPVVTCPPDQVYPVGYLVTPTATIVDDGQIVDHRWRFISVPPGSNYPAGGEIFDPFSMRPQAPGTYVLRHVATDNYAQRTSCEWTLNAAAHKDCADGLDNDFDNLIDEDAPSCVAPPSVTCPSDTSVPTHQPTTLIGSASDSGSGAIVATWWSFVSQPFGSEVTVSAGIFEPRLAGEYVLRYTALDDVGNLSSCDVAVNATVIDGFRTEMIWMGAHVDLHVLHPSATAWFGALDCYLGSACDAMPLPWGTPAADDDPFESLGFVQIHDIETSVPVPELGAPYSIGVHYDRIQAAPVATVFVNVYCGGSLAAMLGPVMIDANGSPNVLMTDFWKVADVSFNGAACSVTPLLDSMSQPQIVTRAAAELAR